MGLTAYLFGFIDLHAILVTEVCICVYIILYFSTGIVLQDPFRNIQYSL